MCGDLTSAFNFKTPNADALPQLDGKQTRVADALRENQEALPAVPVPTDISYRFSKVAYVCRVRYLTNCIPVHAVKRMVRYN